MLPSFSGGDAFMMLKPQPLVQLSEYSPAKPIGNVSNRVYDEVSKDSCGRIDASLPVVSARKCLGEVNGSNACLTKVIGSEEKDRTKDDINLKPRTSAPVKAKPPFVPSGSSSRLNHILFPKSVSTGSTTSKNAEFDALRAEIEEQKSEIRNLRSGIQELDSLRAIVQELLSNKTRKSDSDTVSETKKSFVDVAVQCSFPCKKCCENSVRQRDEVEDDWEDAITDLSHTYIDSPGLNGTLDLPISERKQASVSHQDKLFFQQMMQTVTNVTNNGNYSAERRTTNVAHIGNAIVKREQHLSVENYSSAESPEKFAKTERRLKARALHSTCRRTEVRSEDAVEPTESSLSIHIDELARKYLPIKDERSVSKRREQGPLVNAINSRRQCSNDCLVADDYANGPEKFAVAAAYYKNSLTTRGKDVDLSTITECTEYTYYSGSGSTRNCSCASCYNKYNQ